MKTIKAIYYYMKQKKARLYFDYWHDKALVNIKDTKKCRSRLAHIHYRKYKMLDYNVAIHKELES